jgi:hypothetical protein
MMKRFLSLVLLLLLALSYKSFSQSKKIGNQDFSFASGHWHKNTRDGKSYRIDNEIITVKFKSADFGQIIRKYGLSIVRKSRNGYYDIQVPKNVSVLEIGELIYQDSSAIESVDINTYGAYSFSPNDTQFSNQWYLNKIGMVSGWNKARGGNCVQVAIIDSGVDIAHEDIGRGVDTYDNLWRNLGEDAWTDPNNPATGNGIDNDGNGLIDDWRGWDFVDSNNDVRSPVNTHGTRVAGIVAAKLNNNRGISGIGGGPNNTGLQLMVLGVGELGPSSAALDDAILYAVQNGADVIQMSLTVAQTAAIDNAIQTAINNGIPVVCASGNNNSGVSYPANNANVIAVGSTNQNDQRSSFSNFGDVLFISAPGEQIRSTQLNNTYGNDDGTSFSAPQVSSVIGLIRSISPNLTVQQIRNVLSSTADKVGGFNYNWDPNRPGHSRELGFGRLNANAALNSVFPSVNGPTLVCTNGTFTLNNPPGAATWSVTPSSVVSPSSGSGTVANIARVGNGSATITFNFGCANISYGFWVGNPTTMPEFTNVTFDGMLTPSVCPDLNQTFTTGQHTLTALTNVQNSFPVFTLYSSGFISGSGSGNNFNFNVKRDDIKFTVSYRITDKCATVERCTYFSNTGPIASVVIYPNPAEDRVTIQLGKEGKLKQVVLFSNTQAQVFSDETIEKEMVIQTSGFPDGNYIVKITIGDKVYDHHLYIKH